MFRVLRSTLALGGLALALSLTSGQARADILYTYTRPLSLISGPDTAGLNGATAVITFTVPSSATYVERFSIPAVPVVNPVLTITGASVGANNGVYSLAPLAFYPTFAGFFTEPGGAQPFEPLAVGGNLILQGNTVPTASGLTVNIGDLVSAAHFGPATPTISATWANDDSEYGVERTTITAVELGGGGSAAPEPATGALVGVLGIAGLVLARRRR